LIIYFVFVIIKAKEGDVMLFNITIEEVVSSDFKIEANTYEEAIKLAKEKYNKGELVLEPGNVNSKQLGILNGNDYEWIEF
jgi:hypothetical protein